MSDKLEILNQKATNYKYDKTKFLNVNIPDWSVDTTEVLEALDRVASNASYGITSGDYEIMNPEGFSKDMEQHEKDVEAIRKALTSTKL